MRPTRPAGSLAVAPPGGARRLPPTDRSGPLRCARSYLSGGDARERLRNDDSAQVRSNTFRDHPGRATRLHRHPEQAVAGLHRPLLVADDEQLGLLAELVDQDEEAVQVDVLECLFDLAAHVEGRRPAAEHGEQIAYRGELTLPAGQERQLLDVLPTRLGLDLDARV